MTYNIYRIVFYVSGGLGIAFLILAIILFFKLKIHKIIGDLNGKNAQKAIQGIYEQNANGNGMRLSGKVTRLSVTPNGTAYTEKIVTQQMARHKATEETMVLNAGFGILEDITFVHTNTTI